MSQKKRTTLETLGKIDFLMEKGVTHNGIAKTIDISDDNASVYMKALRAAKEGKPYCINPSTFSHNLVVSYCAQKGYPAPVNTYGVSADCEQITIQDSDSTENEVDALAKALIVAFARFVDCIVKTAKEG